MKKLAVFIILAVLIAIAALLLNRQSLKNSGRPVVHGTPYAGGSGAGYASAGYSGRADGSDVKR